METITSAQKHLAGRGNGKERYLVWNTSLKTAISTPGFLAEHAPALVSLLLDTLPATSQRGEERAINSLVRAALAAPDGDEFLKALAAALVKHSSGSSSTLLGPRAAFTLLEWNCCVLEALPADGSSSKATAKLLEAQASLLNLLYRSGPDGRAFQSSCRAVMRLLRVRPQLLPEYAAAAAASGSAGMVRAVLAAALQRHSQQQQGEQDRQAVAAALLPVLCDQVLASRTKPPAHLLAAYQPLLSALTPEELSDKLLPAANKAMRRTPEPAIAALADMLQQVQLDLSSAAPELATLLVQQLRAKEGVRPSAEAALAALAARVQDPAAGLQLVQQLSKLLGGSSAEGKVKVAGERAALAAALTALSSLPEGAAGEASSAAAAFCSIFYKEEPVEDVKLALLSCLAAWLPKCTPTPPAAAVQQLAAGLGEAKESLRRGNLRAAAAAVKAALGLAGAMGPLAAPLAKIVSEGCAKAVARADGVAALLLAAQVAAADSTADAALDKAGVWGGPVSAESPLLSAATLAKLSPAEAALAPQLAQVLLLQHNTRLKGGAHEAVCRLLPLCLLHHSPEVRRAAVSSCQAVVAAAPDLMAPLLAGLRHWANNTGDALVLADTAAGEAVSPAVGTYSHAFAAAVLALLPKQQQQQQQQQEQQEQDATQQNGHHHPSRAAAEAALAGSGLPELLLMSHHPAITAGVAKQLTAWQVAVKRLGGVVPAALKDHAPEVLSVLFGPSGLGSSCSGDVAAAQMALGSCMAVAPLASLDPLLAGLADWLNRTQHEALTDEDFNIFTTPEGMLSSEVVPEGVYVPEVVVSKNVRKARGRMKSGNRAFATADDDDSDDEPAPAPAKASAVRPSQAAAAGRGGGRGGAGGVGGKGPKDSATRQAEHRLKKLAEEAEVRARVGAIKARLDTGLAALNAAVQGNTRFSATHLREFSGLCQPLMGSPVCGDAAFAAVRSLARCMPPPLCTRSLLLAGSLRLVGLAARGAQGVTYDSIPERSAVSEVVTALYASTVANRQPLPGPSYALVFPVVAAVLHCPVITPLHDQALGVLTLHVAPEQDIPRGDSLELLYHLLGIIPAYRDRVQPLLRSLCSGVSDPELVPAVSGLLAGSAAVRATALSALPHVPTLAEGVAPESAEVTAVLALARHDVNEDNAAAADTLWQQAGCVLETDLIPLLVQHLSSQQADTRAAAAAALAEAVALHPTTTSSTLQAVVGLYGEDLEDDLDDARAAILLDDAERASREAARVQQNATRSGVATALEALSGVLSGADVHAALDFLVNRGLAEPVDGIREAMVGAGVALVDAHGEALAQQLLPRFESYLNRDAAARLGLQEDRYDLVREGVVVLLGMMAGHLAPGDDKRRSIISMLFDVLSTPSEAVQRAVSNCLPRLVQPLAADKEFIQNLLDGLLAELKSGGPGGYGLRRGAAYGISGIVKGLGIASLKGYGVLEALKAMVENKKDAEGREGSLQAFECLCEKLGRLFEPYVIHILPLLLQCFGDGSPQVRAAAEDAARSIMGQLSASGVKLVLPALLKGLEDSAWRTKQGSIQMLGAMAHCAPKQLGSCLPTIVPRLGGVLGDPHPKVQAAAKEALQEVGSVIRSPEMSALVPALLAAIADPNLATRDCLDTLLSTTFVNTIDAPSLALVVPVVHRGLRDRTGDTKKRAARIAGTMCSLTNDPKDMAPYVPLLMPELQKALLDPLPEVRATAARAMGSLLKGMGTGALGDLLPWLLTTLRSEGSSVERSGAAQGLAEVLSVMGDAHLSELLPELAASATSKNPFVREGHLTLFRYLPLTMESEFQGHLGDVLPLILDGLSDEAEGVRDAALSAGRCFVEAYARTSMPLLLPAVEKGLSGENWRIRQSSLELCGDILFKVAGTSGKIKLDGGSDDEGAATDAYGAAISEALGQERYAQVLSKLYLARSDVQYVVRNTGLHIWKTIVVNTPRTLQEILPALMAEVINALADPSEDRRACAARCLGELVRKMGERVLHRMLPILRDTMASPDAATRQGVCTGLKELLENVTRHQLTEHLADILPPIQGALCDPDSTVREAAGSAFGVLFKGGAHGAVESVVPSLLHGLDSPAHASQSMEGLRVILGVRPQVFHGIVPKLLKQPVSSAGLRALGQLAGTAAPVLPSHLSAILATCLTLSSGHTPAAAPRRSSIDNHKHEEPGSEPTHDPREEAAGEAALAVALAVEEDGVASLVSELLGALEEVAGRALGAARLVGDYARATKHDLEDHVDDLLTALVLLLAEESDPLVLAAWKACEALAATIPKESQAKHVGPLKEALAGAKEKQRRKRRGGPLHLKGLVLPPKALAPFVPIYLQGVLQGLSAEVREVAAEGLGELVGLTSEEGLKPFVVTITGPLIRIIGDKFPPATKAAILVTLGQLIMRAGAGLKPFVPQLQTTFVKCLNDQAAAVRMTAADNLGQLTRLSARVEVLVADLANSAANAPEPETAAAYLTALSGALAASGDRLTPPTLDKVQSSLLTLYRSTGGRPSSTSGAVDPTAAALATALARYCAVAGPAGMTAVLEAGPLGAKATGSQQERELAAMLLAAVAAAAGAELEAAGLLKRAAEAAVKFTRDAELSSVRVAGGRAVCRLYSAHRNLGPALSTAMTTLLGPDQASEVARQAMMALTRLAAVDDGAALGPHLTGLLPSICSILQREPNSQVRAAAEGLLKAGLRLDLGLETGQTAAAAAGGTTKSFLTDAYLRRLASRVMDDWEQVEEY